VITATTKLAMVIIVLKKKKDVRGHKDKMRWQKVLAIQKLILLVENLTTQLGFENMKNPDIFICEIIDLK
jgi:hypothetical protein